VNKIRACFQIRESIDRRIYYAAAAFGFLVSLLAWQGVSAHYASQGKEVLFPSPGTTLQAALDYVGHGARASERLEEAREEWEALPVSERDTWKEIERGIRQDVAEDMKDLRADLRVSFIRVTSAFLLSALLAIPLGLYLGAYKLLEAFIQPVTEFSRYVPIPALVPVLIVLFGIGETPKIMLIFLGTFSQMLLMVKEEIQRVPRELLQAAKTLGATRTETLMRVLAPSAMPGIFDALRICNGWAWTWLIVAELVAANEGMGFRIIRFQRFLQTDRIFVYLILLGLIGLVLDLLFRLLNNRLFRWSAS
jgi:NitT/TauT family transport system permease protein